MREVKEVQRESLLPEVEWARKYRGRCCVEIQANVSLRRAAAPSSSLNLLNDTLEAASFEKHRVLRSVLT